MELSCNIYQLPFEGMLDVKSAPYHYEINWQKNAVDFAMPVGTLIIAALDGIVYQTIDGFDEGKFEDEYLQKSNKIMIQHQNDEFSGYAHLQKGLLVHEGQKVNAGEIIGYSGLSGFTSYPHLHFQIMKRNESEIGWITVPTRFLINDVVKVLVSPEK